MKTHVEYDDFGEFIEVLDDVQTESTYTGGQKAGKVSFAKKTVRGFLATLMAVTVVFSTTSFASAASVTTCSIGGCCTECHMN